MSVGRIQQSTLQGQALQDAINREVRRILGDIDALKQRDTVAPWLEANSSPANTIDIAIPNTAGDDEIRLTLQNGRQYSFDGDLRWGTSMLAPGVSWSADTWYALYLVPSGEYSLRPIADERFDSTTGRPVGPRTHANWCYLGPVRSDGSSNVRDFWQTGPQTFHYKERIQPSAASSLSTTFHNPAINLSLTDVVPLSARAALVDMVVAKDATNGEYVLQRMYVDGESNDYVTNYSTSTAGGSSNFNSTPTFPIPLPTIAKRVQYQTQRSGASSAISSQDVRCTGFVDGFAGLRGVH